MRAVFSCPRILFHDPRAARLDGAMHGIWGKVEVTWPSDRAAFDPGLGELVCIPQRRENAGGSRVEEACKLEVAFRPVIEAHAQAKAGQHLNMRDAPRGHRLHRGREPSGLCRGIFCHLMRRFMRPAPKRLVQHIPALRNRSDLLAAEVECNRSFSELRRSPECQTEIERGV